jgi:enoyl-CoA hydratase
MTDSPPIEIEDRGAVRIMTLNRPDKLNAISGELHEELLTALQRIKAARTIRAAVLTGSGRAFSAGADMQLIKRMQDDRAVRDETMAIARALFEEFASLRIPIIAAVNGAAVGAGCTLALLCDVVIMEKSSFLAETRVTVGLVPGDGGSILWPLLGGLAVAKAYLLTGDRISASEAWRLGLVHQVVDSDPLGTAMAIAERIASYPALAVQETKRLLDLRLRESAMDLDRAIEAESRCFDDDEHRSIIP